MPNYVYRGTECPHQFEVYQSFADDPLTECTECGMPVRRVFQPTGLVFKGSGWYITDSRKGSTSESSNGASSPASSSTESKTETAKTDSAPKAEPVGAAKD